MRADSSSSSLSASGGAVWRVYVLVCADGSLYCGVTTDVDRRLKQHNGDLPGGAKYTRGRGPVSLLAAVECPDQATALRLEAAVKKARGKERKLRALCGPGR